jgi:hypothetical protein
VFAARGTDLPGYTPPLGLGLAEMAAWVNAQPDLPSLEIVGGFMRERALETIEALPWDRVAGSDRSQGDSTSA